MCSTAKVGLGFSDLRGHASWPESLWREVCLEEFEGSASYLARALIRINDIEPVSARRMIHDLDHRVLLQSFRDELVDAAIQSCIIPSCAPDEDGRKRMTISVDLLGRRSDSACPSARFARNSLHSRPPIVVNVRDTIETEDSSRIGGRFTQSWRRSDSACPSARFARNSLHSRPPIVVNVRDTIETEDSSRIGGRFTQSWRK